MSKLKEWLLRSTKSWLVPGLVLLMAAGILLMITGNWNVWASERTEQKTDDAYTHADVTPLSTKAAGLVAAVAVSDYQAVKVGDLLVQLRDDDFRAQVQQAAAAVTAGEAALVNNQRQKELQEARIIQAVEGIRAAEADITAAEAGVDAAKSAVVNARSAMDSTQADVARTESERHRQEALIALESATRQKVEQAVADAQRFSGQLASRNSEIAAATAQQASRDADLTKARAQLGSRAAELEAQKRQRSVLDSQEMLLKADLNEERAALVVARTNLGYTRILAPESGKVGERKVLPGQMVSPGTQVISLVQDDLWVQANYRETQVRHMRPGDPATIRIDAFPGVVLNGKVDYLSPASGSRFALLPPDNATGNFTKIVQRVPVKIVLDRNQPSLERLRDGLSVTAMVRTNNSAQ
ncbi:MAG TPA: HlyD family secretion protein [Bryobacteraceae bacterium]|jgi:membrane fusion protein (multidrug efflux system)|nr:HlyD family secretion protein [Bryobacteraceae bacterium]